MIDLTPPKLWGGEPYYGLDHEFDPLWYLTDEQRDLQTKLIEVCHDVIRPQAIEADKTGDYPRESLQALADLGVLGIIVPKELGGRGENNVGTLMVTETIARYGCPSTALIYMMHMVAVAALVFRAKGNAEIEDLLSRIDSECLVGTASYTDPETGGHFWYPKTSGAERVAGGWHVRKKAAWTTSSGFADWYVTQTTSPDFAGDYSDLSVFLLYPDEVQPKLGMWDAMGMHANQSGPLDIDAVIPPNRIVGWPGDGAASNDEAVDPLAMVMYAGAYNGVALACIDVAKRHATRRSHAQYGRTVADYATIQDTFGGAVTETQASRVFAYAFSKALDDLTDNGSWAMYADDRDARPRASLGSWSFEAKLLAAGLASRVSDTMLQVCGGRGYMRGAEIERLVRDSKAGWVMAPSNEVTRQLVGRWALFGGDSIDWWNQHVDEPVLQNELSKLDSEGKRRILDQLQGELAPETVSDERSIMINASLPPKTDLTDFDPPLLGHLGMRPELVVRTPEDERVWIEIEPNVWFRPLFFDMNTGSHGEILRVRRGGTLSRHRHPSPVHGYVLKGSWRYLEHSWTATEGSYVFEPPGEVHTLTVDGDHDEMQTLFIIMGAVLYIDDNDQVQTVEDNVGLIELAREHYEQVGLGADFVDQFIR